MQNEGAADGGADSRSGGGGTANAAAVPSAGSSSKRSEPAGAASAEGAKPDGADPKQDSREVLARALADATLALGRAGQPEKANRLAAAGYAAVRRELPRAARRLNAVMHDISKQPEDPQAGSRT